MKITACYIVKNEAAVLARSIASVRACADEVLVVDTGSDDATIEAARQCGARVLQHPWQQDFSEARNFALDAAAGDWIVFLDADEYFTPQTQQNLRAVIERNRAADGILVKRIDVDEDRENEVQAVLFVLRIFPRRQDLRFVGRIHEELQKNGRELDALTAVSEAELAILHTGYSSTLSRQKAERNLALLQQELQETKQPERIYGYLADAYLGLDDKAQAMHYARLDIALGRRSVTYASRSYRIILQLLAESTQAGEAREKIAAQAVREFPELPEFHAEYAECLALRFAYEQAEHEMQEALQVLQQPAGMEQTQLDDTDEAAGLFQQRLELWRQIQDRENSIRVAACVITKNEAEHIEQWLEGAKQYADTILVVDTGSEDDTVSLALQAGADVRHFAWQQDFAAARNFALDQVEADWIVFNDADEYFDRPERLRFLLAETDVCRPQTDVLMTMSPNIDADNHNHEISRYLVGRILRCQPELRYVGKVHEQVKRRDGETKIHAERERILLYHTGYSTGRILQKLRRNLELLQADIRLHGEGAQHYRYLADCYFGFRDYEKALHYALLAIEAPLQAIASNSDMYHEAMESMRQLKKPLPDMLAFAGRAIQRFPLLPDFYAERGMVLCGMEKLAEARESFERALELFETPLDTSGEATSFLGSADIVCCRLGKLYAQDGAAEQAMQCCEKALHYNPRNQEALALWLDCQRQEPVQKLAGRLAELCGRDAETRDFLKKWAEKYGFVQLYRYYAAETHEEKAERSELYAMAGRGEVMELQQRSLEQAARILPEFFAALLFMKAPDTPNAVQLQEGLAAMLPQGLRRVLRRCQGGQEALTADCLDGYLAVFSAVTGYASAKQRQVYARVAQDFSVPQLYEAARRWYTNGYWDEALALYAAIPADAACVTAEFWHDIGVCFYHSGQPETAEECFEKAEQLGGDWKDIAAYRQWSGEGNRA